MDVLCHQGWVVKILIGQFTKQIFLHWSWEIFWKHSYATCSFFFKKMSFMAIIRRCGGSLLLCGLFPSCGEWELLRSCGAWASHRGGFSWCGAQALGHQASVVANPGLWNTGSTVVGQGPSCSLVCGIFPDKGSNLCFLYWEANSLPLSHQGSPTCNFCFTCE